ncbi:MAG: TatD family hydrolase [Kiritimatiellales bacterium]
MAMKLFDSHCHLQDAALLPDIGKVMEHAVAAGVERMACCGTSSADWTQVLQLASEFPQVIPMIGIHPWFVSNGWKGSLHTLEKMVREIPNIGIGETGLDFQEKFTNRAEQEASFAAHLDLARELNRPVAVHCVHAWGRLLEILREHPAPKIILHAFGGAPELIPDLVELNCWFSFCGSLANPNAKRVRASAVAVPADRLLIETDSPDFPPTGCPSPNEPANLIHVAHAVAELRGVSSESLAALTFANAEHFFTSV